MSGKTTKMSARKTLALSLLAAAAGLATYATPATAATAAKTDDGKGVAIFAGGCFWCVESDFDHVPGVVSTTSGYIGGKAETAHYKVVTGGNTGHYEAVKIVYDPEKVSYGRLLHVFWRSVDPTDDGGQFCDRGDSYKTAVFALDDKQRQAALVSKKKAEAALGKKIVTPIHPPADFYPAETYHQDYYRKNPFRYKLYRTGCGRDLKIRYLWGEQAHDGIDKH